MSTINIKALSMCDGGEHVVIRCSEDAQVRKTIPMLTADLRHAVDDAEIENAIRVLIRWYAKGKTGNQVRTGLQAGFDVVIG